MPPFLIRRCRLLILALLACAPLLKAQIPGLPSKSSATPSTIFAPSPDAAEARLRIWLTEAQKVLSDISQPGVETRLPEGVDTLALADYRRNLEQIKLGIGRHQKVLESTPDARKALESARLDWTSWSNFAEKPPYSILLIDGLLDQQDSIKEKAASYRSSLELFNRSLAKVQEDARISEDASRQALSDAAGNPAKEGAAQWKLNADRAYARLLALRAMSLQSNIELLQVQNETAKLQLSLLERKIAIAKKNPSFSENDLATVNQATVDRQKAVHKEIEVTRAHQLDAMTAKSNAQAELDVFYKDLPEGQEPPPSAGLALAKVTLEAAETRATATQFIIENLESLDQLDAFTPDIYQARKELLEATTKEEREAPLLALRSHDDRLNAWQIVVRNELASVNADIGNQESRATSMTEQDPRMVPITEMRAAVWEKQAVMQRILQFTTSQSRMLKRWLDDYESVKIKSTFSESVAHAAESAWESVKQVWNLEVFEYKDTVMAAGVPITQTRGVALSRIVIAVAYFLIAYVACLLVKNRVRGLIVRRGHLAEPQAKTLSNWLMIVVAILLAVATLHFLRIPLTVFAFFGGALVIGIGFGTQTLIKNFISGIIMLFERKIRVGDVLDMDGKLGTVTEVNTRSSVIRNFDGRETLVPNSVFLEKSITNVTLNDRNLRRFILVRVEYGTSPHKVTAALMDCADRHGLVLKAPAPLVIFQDFAEDALIFKLYFWVQFNAKTNGELVESDLRQIIDKQFHDQEIPFAYPRRDIHLITDSPIQVEAISSTKVARRKAYQ